MDTATKHTAPATVDEYMKALPDNQRMALEKLRKTIRSIVPKAEEVISYQIPTYKYNGKLVGFAAFTNHCSFFTMNSTLVKQLGEELKEYKTAPGTIQFAIDKPLPTALIKKIIAIRLKENEALLLARMEKKAPTKKIAAPK